MKITCKICGENFSANPYRIKKGWANFCSTKCYGKWKTKVYYGKRAIISCIVCKKTFQVMPYRTNKAKFCSYVCCNKWMSENNRKENNSNWKGGKEISCIICGNKFWSIPSKFKQSKLCSRECFSKWQSAYRSGKNSSTWKGGLSFEPYSTGWTKTLKQSIRERDCFQCKVCRVLQTKTLLCVHHIDYNKKNNDPKNLITLCGKCHPKTNFKREYWRNKWEEKSEKN